MVETSYSDASVKIPPHDLDAEEAVLGSCLLDPEAIHKVASLLRPADFYREKHRWTYECCLAATPDVTDQITIAHELAKRNQLEAVGGAAYLSHLVSSTPSAVHIEYYAEIVHKLGYMRKLISVANQIAAVGYEIPSIDDADARVDEIIARLRNGHGGSRKGFDL